MIKISIVEAYSGMNEIDFNVMDDELLSCFGSDQRGDRKQSHQFYLDNKNNIILEIYWDGEKVHTVAFENKGELTEQGEKRLAEQERDAAVNNKGVEKMKKTISEKQTIDLAAFVGKLKNLIEKKEVQ